MTQVTINICQNQADCYEEYGCFVSVLTPEDSIPVGHPIRVAFDGEILAEAIIMAIQVGDNGEDIYVLADSTKVDGDTPDRVAAPSTN